MLAAWFRGDLDVINVLVKGGADVNAEGRNIFSAIFED